MSTKRSGFHVLNYAVRLYSLFTGKKLPDMPTASKVRWNQRCSVIRQTYGWDSDTLQGLIDYMYWHNPLGVSDLGYYGKVDAMSAAAPYYAKFLRAHADAIKERGIGPVVFEFRPQTQSDDEELFKHINELAAGY